MAVLYEDANYTCDIYIGGKLVTEYIVKDIEDIDIAMPDYIYKEITVYPDIINSGAVRNEAASIERECQDNLIQILMVIAGRYSELIESCEQRLI